MNVPCCPHPITSSGGAESGKVRRAQSSGSGKGRKVSHSSGQLRSRPLTTASQGGMKAGRCAQHVCRVQSSAEGLPRVELKVCRGAVKQEDAKAEIGRGIRPAPASAQSPGHPAPSSSSVDQPSPSPASPPSTADGPTSSARARVVTAGGGSGCGPSAAAHRRAGGRARVPRGAACRPVLGSRAGQEGEGLPWLAGDSAGGMRRAAGRRRGGQASGGPGGGRTGGSVSPAPARASNCPSPPTPAQPIPPLASSITAAQSPPLAWG